MSITTATIRQASTSDLYGLLAEIESELAGREAAEFPAAVAAVFASRRDLRDAVAEHGAPVQVVWPTTEWEDGYAFDPDCPRVTFEDGTALEVPLHGSLIELAAFHDGPLSSDHVAVFVAATGSVVITTADEVTAPQISAQ